MSVQAIRDASVTLIQMLRTNIDSLNETNAIIGSPGEVREQNDIRLTLYLYSIIENPELKNEDHFFVNTRQSQKAPLSLDLYYMLTVYPGQTQQLEQTHEGNLEAHRTLGRVMRIFYDNGIISGNNLQGDLRTTDQALRLTLNPITVEDLTRIWSVFPESSYRPSVCYLVTPVRVDSEEITSTQRVVEKRTDVDRMIPTGVS